MVFTIVVAVPGVTLRAEASWPMGSRRWGGSRLFVPMYMALR
jgi:hypothetical protein